MKILLHWLIAALAIGVTAYLLPGVHVDSLFAAFVAALVLGFLNLFIRPILIILTLPINILTLGLFTLVINAALVMLASSWVAGFAVDSWTWALVFSIVLFVVNMLFGAAKSKEEAR